MLELDVFKWYLSFLPQHYGEFIECRNMMDLLWIANKVWSQSNEQKTMLGNQLIVNLFKDIYVMPLNGHVDQVNLC
jgi:hypothetical protein